jgi:hypothetical protein
VVSAHRVLARAIARAEQGFRHDDPPTDDAIALLRNVFRVVVVRVVLARKYVTPDYEWVVVDGRTGERVYVVPFD